MRIGLLLEKKLNNPKYKTMQKRHKCEGKTFTLKKSRTIISYSFEFEHEGQRMHPDSLKTPFVH